MGRELAAGESEISNMEDVCSSDAKIVWHVKKALKSVTKGDNLNYEQLRKVIHDNKYLSTEQVTLLEISLRGLSGAVSDIDSAHHGTLLDSIFQMKLWYYGPEVMDAIIDLIISLAAAGKHIDACLSMLVGNFVPPSSFMQYLEGHRGEVRKGEVFDHIHTALKKITELVPTAPMLLSNIIVQRMPSIFKGALVAMYVENMLLLENGSLGELVGNLMLIAVVDRLVDFDVEIEVFQDDSNKSIFEIELEDEDGFMQDNDIEGNELHEVSSRLKRFQGKSFTEILDSLLVIMFEHLNLCHKCGRLNQVFENLLGSFETTILGTYKSKFSQFVMFYACSLDPDCGRRFAFMVLDIFEDSNKPPIRRMGAIAYLASYLSRAKFLPLPFVTEMLQRLVNWCLIYCKNHDSDINTEAHRVFYAGCQAMMYVLCFRMRSIRDIDRLKLQLSSMHIETILRHRLSPLKVCLPSIVEEFLRQAKAASLFKGSDEDVSSDLLESELSRAFGGTERLDMFFPFDPCTLQKTDRFIRPSFIYWSMVKPDYDDEDEDEEIEANSEVDDEEYMRSMRGEDSMAGSDEDPDQIDFNRMSITPKSELAHQFGTKLNDGGRRMPSKIRPSTSPESL